MTRVERKYYLARLIRHYRRVVEYNTEARRHCHDAQAKQSANQAIKDARARLTAARLELYYLCAIGRNPGSDHVST